MTGIQKLKHAGIWQMIWDPLKVFHWVFSSPNLRIRLMTEVPKKKGVNCSMFRSMSAGPAGVGGQGLY